MKLSVLTFHAAPNHGAAFQAYALQTHLRKSGHETYFINYPFGVPPRRGLRRWIGRNPLSTVSKVNEQLRIRPFIRFQKEFLIIGQKEYLDHIQLQNDPPIAAAYICGSDQIWNPRFITLEKDEHAFWLDFGVANTRRVAYAASFGVSALDDKTRSRYALYARRFHAIGVRERDAVGLMQTLGRTDAVWVPDPTLLLSQAEYGSIEYSKNETKVPYLFSYILGTDNTSLALQVNATLCEMLKTDCYNAYRKSLLNNILHNGYIGPCDWLSRLGQSHFVLTNSFHATVFSLLYHRPFIVILRTGEDAGGNSRLTSLLDIVGLGKRAIVCYDHAHIEGLCRDKVDWDRVDSRIQQFREIGFRFLRDALS